MTRLTKGARTGLWIMAFPVAVMVIGLALVQTGALDGFIERRIRSAFTDAYPGGSLAMDRVHFALVTNTLTCEGFTASPGPGAAWKAARLSLDGIRWFRLVLGDPVAAVQRARLTVEGADILPAGSAYRIRFASLHSSVEDSLLTFDALMVEPAGDDGWFFARSPFRSTRFRMGVKAGRIEGAGFGTRDGAAVIRVGAARLAGAVIDILINKERRPDPKEPPSLMPHEALAAMGGDVRIDSLIVDDGDILYGERFLPDGRPAWLTFTRAHLAAAGITTVGDTVTIAGEAFLMNAAPLRLRMVLPTGQQEFSMACSGSLGAMPLDRLNPWMIISDHTRITSGNLRAALFDVRVDSGAATGTVKAVYSDLAIAVLDKRTGRGDQVDEMVATLLANTIKLRGSNLPDDEGRMATGNVWYRKRADDAFMGFVWFAIRSGLGDLIGF